MEEYTGYVDSEYLDRSADWFRKLKQHSYSLIKAQEGNKILDVGCGPGTDTLPLAQIVTKSGEVVGVDDDEEMVEEANRRAKKAKVDRWVVHQKKDAYDLGFCSDYFDACRCDRVFIHLDDSTSALQEMIRVTKESGWIVVIDTDWGTFSIDTEEIEIERKLARYMAEKMLKNGYAGRKLFRQFRKHKLSNIALEMFSVPVTNYELAKNGFMLEKLEREALDEKAITRGELKRWRGYIEKTVSEDAFYMSVSGVIISGQKPYIDG